MSSQPLQPPRGAAAALPLCRRCRRLRDHETGSTVILADILSDIPSGVLSDIFSDILSGILFDIFGILSGTYSDVLSDILAGLCVPTI